MATEASKPNIKNSKKYNENARIKATVPDGGWGWVVCLSCLFGNFAVGGVCMSFGIILPSLKEYYGESTGIISLVGSVLVGLILATGPIAASLTNRFGLRAVYMAGSLISGISLLASTFSPNVYILLLTYGVLSGTAFGLIILPVSVACNYYFEKRRALATGIAKTGFSLGGFIYPPMTELVLHLFDWKAVIYMYAGIAFISCFFGALIKPLELVAANSVADDKEKEESKDATTSNQLTRRPSLEFKVDSVEISRKKLNQQHCELKPESRTRGNSISKLQETLSVCSSKDEPQRRNSMAKIQHLIEKNTDGETEFVFQPSQRRGSKILLPPLAKHESFYDGSIKDLSEIDSMPRSKKKSPDNNGDVKFRPSIVNVSAFDKDAQSKDSGFILWKFIDPEFWCNPSLMLLLISRFLGHFSVVLFFMFLPTLLLDRGFSLGQASLMLTALGISNSIFRITVGALMDHPRVSPALLTTAGFILQGIIQCMLPFLDNYVIFLVFGGVMGCVQAPYNVGLSIILGEMVPMEKIASTFGKMALFQGIGSIIGPSVAGLIYDVTNDVKLLFFMAAGVNFIAGIVCGVSGYIYNKSKNVNSRV
jgi:MFS family permease